MAEEKAISAYLDKFKQLKERNSLKEIVEREMLLEFININHEHIAEFPLLETEQLGIINLLAKRAAEHPTHEYLRQWLGEFLLSLNKYAKAKGTQDKDGIAENSALIANAEAILIQCIQGAVFVTGLVKDNLAHTIIRHFGPESMETIRHTQEHVEFDERYWRTYLEAFVLAPVKTAYTSIVSEKKVQVAKEEQSLVIRFHLDDVIANLPSVTAEIKKTRIQAKFEECVQDEQGQHIHNLVAERLRNDKYQMLSADFSPQEIAYAAQVVCMDPISRTFYELSGPAPAAAQPAAEGDPPVDPEVKRLFVWQQVVAMALGAALGAAIVRNDLIKALKELSSNEAKAVDETVANFELPRLEAAFFQLLEFYFAALLREKGADEGGKLVIRQTRQRRVSAAALKPLYELGLNRIRQKKIWNEDASKSEQLLFKPRTPQELVSLMKVFHFEPALEGAIIGLWRDALFKVEILVVINLTLLARVTTNLSQRVSEILSKYQISLR